MKTEFKASFLKAIKKIKEQQLKTDKHYCRIRIKDYRYFQNKEDFTQRAQRRISRNERNVN